MSLTSADMQNLIPKTQEVGRVRQVQDRQGEVNQQQTGSRFAEQVAQRLQQVPSSPRSHEARVDRDQKKKDRGNRDRREQRQDGKEDGRPPDRDRGRHIDVRV